MLSRGLVGIGVVGLAIVGCTDRSPRGDSRTGSASEALFSAPEKYTGADLDTKQLVLTFDDGPSYTGRQTRAISSYLKGLGIKTTFFVVGSCIDATALPTDACSDPADDADGSIRQVLADGHLVANHTTTHRDMPTLSTSAVMTDLAETDRDLAPYASLIPWNRWFFRAPMGDWTNALSTAADAYKDGKGTYPLRKYVAPIYWNAGGDTTNGLEADWHCWQDSNLTTKECGDKYVAEIRSKGKGIVLMHDQEYGSNTNLPAHPVASDYAQRPGNTYLLVHYVIEQLGAAWSYHRLDEVPSIAAALPTCDASCATCNGASSTSCLSCSDGKWLSGGACSTCSVCPADSFQESACTATADTVCHACTTCGAGTFQTAACTATADTTCQTCTTCPNGSHVVTACTATADTVCADNPPPLDAGIDDGHGGTHDDAGAGGAGSTDSGGTTGSSGASPTDAGTVNNAADNGSDGGCATAPVGGRPSLVGLALAGLVLVAVRRRGRSRK